MHCVPTVDILFLPLFLHPLILIVVMYVGWAKLAGIYQPELSKMATVDIHIPTYIWCTNTTNHAISISFLPYFQCTGVILSMF